MKLFLLDTSTKNFSLAITQGDKVLVSQDIILEKILSSSIIPNIVQALKKARMTLSDIDGFGVGIGPGSFTSLRVGLATLKGLIFALHKPIVGISSLDVIAQGVPSDKDPLCVVSDARRDLLYVCFYEKKKGILKRKSDPMLLGTKELMRKIKGKTFFVGDGIRILEKQDFRKKDLVLMEESFWNPQARDLLPLVKERFLQKKYDAVEKIKPLYLYAEDCQVQKR